MRKMVDQIFKLSTKIQSLYEEHIYYLGDKIYEANEKQIFLDEKDLVQDDLYQNWLYSIKQCIDLENYCYEELSKKLNQDSSKFKELIVLVKKVNPFTIKLKDIHFLLRHFGEENQNERLQYRRFYNKLYEIALSTNNMDIISLFNEEYKHIEFRELVLRDGKKLIFGDDALPFEIFLKSENNTLLSYDYMLSTAIQNGIYVNSLLFLKYYVYFINKNVEEVVLKNDCIMDSKHFNYNFLTINRKGNQLLYENEIQKESDNDAHEFLNLLYSFSDDELTEALEGYEGEKYSQSLSIYGLLLKSALLKLPTEDILKLENEIINEYNIEEFTIVDDYVKQIFMSTKEELVFSKFKR